MSVEEQSVMQPELSQMLLFEQFRRLLDPVEMQAELKALVLQLAQQALVMQPAVIRHLVDDAAEARSLLRKQRLGQAAPESRP